MDWNTEVTPEVRQEYRSRMALVWRKSSLFRVSYRESIRLGFRELDARTLAELGFPSWAAPNIWLHTPIKQSSELLCIGEDSDEKKILYAITDGRIFVDCEVSELYVAPSIFEFLVLLLEFAELIEKGIALRGSRAYLDGNIPVVLVQDFWAVVVRRLGKDRARESMWFSEFSRMSSGLG